MFGYLYVWALKVETWKERVLLYVDLLLLQFVILYRNYQVQIRLI